MTNSARPDGPAADPERFAAEFSGSERTVAEYLLAQLPERQGQQVRRLLPRTVWRSGAAAGWPTRWPGIRAASGSCRTSRPPTRSWWRWTRRGRGSATAGCSAACAGWPRG
jgi:hypothetical protein